MMNKFLMLISLLILSLAINSCELRESTPQQVFDAVAFNGNRIPSQFKRSFMDVIDRKKRGMLQLTVDKKQQDVTAVKYITSMYGISMTGDIENIKNLKPNEETKPIIAAGLDMFEYTHEIYKNDFPIIAKMIDDGKSDEEVYAAVQILEDTKGAELNKKFDKMMSITLPYADKHGVKYTFQDMGF